VVMRNGMLLRWLLLMGILASSVIGTSSVVMAQSDVDQVSIITPASRANQGWDQQGVDTLLAIGEARGLDVDVVENAGYEDITPILHDLADDGADLIICHASGYQTTCPEFAESTGIPVVVVENPQAVAEGRVSNVETEAQQVAYLAGVMAALETRSGTVAVVVSGEPPTWNYMTAGFAQGVKDTVPTTEVLYSVIGDAAYDDAPNARRTTETVIAAGADIVFGMGDGASFGMIQAILEHNDGAGDSGQVRFVDVIGDKSDSDVAEVLLTSVLFDYTGAYTQFIEDLESGTFGSVYTMSLENGGVRLLDPPADVSEETMARVAEAERRILDGEIDVPAIADPAELSDFLSSLTEGEG
jgi:basic membrane protein A and related proteins